MTFCSPQDPNLSCIERHEAERSGAFYWEPALSAWVRNNHPGVWSRCPWCDGDLPDLNEPNEDGSFDPMAEDEDDDLPWGFGTEEEWDG